MFEATVTKQIEDERIGDLLTGAFEGGSNYWYSITEYINPTNEKVEFKCSELPLLKDCGVMIGDLEDEDAKPILLNREALVKGLKVLEEKYVWHLNNFLDESDDAETSDAFLQCCLFGEIVYS